MIQHDRCTPIDLAHFARMRALGVLVAVMLLGTGPPPAAVAAPATWMQHATITSPQPAVNDRFGSVVDISSSGTTTIVGAATKSFDGKLSVGAAYVFVRSGGDWLEQQELSAADRAAGDEFGAAVAISQDGATVVIGAPLHDVAGQTDTGAAYVFTRSGTEWTQRAELAGSPSGGKAAFGQSVAISGTGTEVAIGAPLQLVSGQRHAGAAFAFKRQASGWVESGFVTAPSPVTDQRFGTDVIVKETLLLASAPYHTDVDGQTGGAIYVFDGTGGTFVPSTVLTGSDEGPNDGFGVTIDLSQSTLVVAAPNHVVAEEAVGVVYLFTHSDSTGIWTERTTLAADDGFSGDQFGSALAIGGTSVAVGAGNRSVGENQQQGVVYVFTGAGARWSQDAELTDSDSRAHSHFGHDTVGVSGGDAVVGEPLRRIGGVTHAGRVAVFAIS